MDSSRIPALTPPPGVVPNFVDPESLAPLTVASVTLYAVGCMSVKSTLLVLYLRIFAPNPRAKIMVWAGLSFNIVFYTISVIVTLATCLPHGGDGGWLSVARNERCRVEDEKFADVQGIIGALTDLYVLLVPMMMIAELRLPRKRKLGVYGVFFTGFLACVVSIINAVFRFKMFQTDDSTWDEVPILALGAAELNFGIICACMPVVFVLFKSFAAETRSWAARLRSWTTRGKTDLEMLSHSGIADADLPRIPKGTVTGLRNFMRGAHSSSLLDTHMTLMQAAPGEVLTYVSVDYDYHTQLRQPDTNTTGSPSKSWTLHRTYEPS
ncbi:hypothetical protein VPNG_03462 [Cytospora leucostoma]|uniref:Rhodopsin domain-containing protein n=1 Tax=Cytospora leucostoma TaxID=1230097 RepID=A0A423XFT2_9PEZI|nr:hypothetical protein VPNG_03462 [Cytospora leucostoma]